MSPQQLAAMKADGWKETDKELPEIYTAVDGYYPDEGLLTVYRTSLFTATWTLKSMRAPIPRPLLWREIK